MVRLSPSLWSVLQGRMETIYGQEGKDLQLNWNVAVTDFVIKPDNLGTSSAPAATSSRPTSGELQDCNSPPLTTLMQVCSQPA